MKLFNNVYSFKLIRAIPTYLLSGSTTLILIFVDGIFAGNFIGSDALIGIALASPLMLICGANITIVSRGTSISISKSLSSDTDEEQWAICKTGAILSVVLMVLFVFLQPVITYIITLGLPKDSLAVHSCIDYATGIFTANIVGVISTVGLYILISYGKSKLILAMTITEVIANIIFEFIFVCILRWGVLGSGLGTSAANIVRMIFTIVVLQRELSFFSILKKKLSLQFYTVITNGIPQFISTVLPSFSLIIVNYLIMFSLGEDGMLAKSLGTYAIQVAVIASSSVNSSLEPLLGLSKGSNDVFGVRKLVRVAFLVGSLLSLLITILLFVFPQILFVIFGIHETNDHVIFLFRTLEITCFTSAIKSLFFTYMVYSEKKLFASALLIVESIILIPFVMLIFIKFNRDCLFYSYFICHLFTILFYILMYMAVCKKSRNPNVLFYYFQDSDDKIYLTESLNKLENALYDLGFKKHFVLKSRLLSEEVIFFNRFVENNGTALIRFGFVVFHDKVLFYSIDNGSKWDHSIDSDDPDKYIADNYIVAKHFTDVFNYKYILDLNYFSYVLNYSEKDSDQAGLKSINK